MKKKTRRTRPERRISDRELDKRPNFDLRTLQRRFCQQKINKLANKIYNEEAAKNYRKLESNFNLEVLYSKYHIQYILDIKRKLKEKEGKPENDG